MGYCPDCGCKSYGGHCTNCHEEYYIMEQNNTNDEPIGFSNEFWDKVRDQENKARRIRIAERSSDAVQERQSEEDRRYL